MSYTKGIMSRPTLKSNDKKIHARVRLFFTGFTMGLVDLIPGVSGGTIAFLFGIYDELLYSIKVMSGQVPRLLLQGKFRAAYQAIPFSFLLPLVLGIALAIFSLVQIVTFFLENYPVQVWAVFFGLVVGSVLVVSKRVALWNVNRWLLLFAGFLLTYLVLGLPVMNTEATPLVLFATGAIAILAMILPGISGSLIMVILGQYEAVIGAVAERNIMKMFFFASGAILGLALFARLLSWLLRNYHSAVIAFLIGVMIGSLRRIWPWQTEQADGTVMNMLPAFDASLLSALILAVGGFVIVWRLEKIGIAREHNEDIETKEYAREVRAQHN